MPLVNSLISWFSTKRLEQLNWYTNYPLEIQQEVFIELINAAKETEWGIKHHYSKIRNIQDFQKNTPINFYDDLKPYIERIKEGEQNILWNTPIKWFAKSSGTTNDKSKFIPVSKESLELCHMRGGKDTLILYTDNNPESRLYKGKSLVLGGSHQISSINMDSYFGDLSAILIQNMPFWAQLYRTPDISIALMDEWESKLEKIAETTYKENVTSLAGVPSWTLVLIKKMMEMYRVKSILDIWPNLELFIHGGVGFSPYREQFKQLMPNGSINYMEVYNASEGFFGIQNDPLQDDMLLMLDLGIFYEFVPLSEIHNPNPQAITLHEVEIGKQYAMLISTNAGLWRYVIGDTIQFTSKFPFKIKIVGRIKHYINVFGEELMIDNTDKALEETCKRTNSKIREYTAGPIYMESDSKGSHEWLIEFEKEPENLMQFSEMLDNHLKTLNSDYEAKRYKDLNLCFPTIQKVPENTFYNWLKKKGKLGGQHKIPRLSNNREYLDDILDFIKNN